MRAQFVDLGSVVFLSRWDKLVREFQCRAHHRVWKGASWEAVRQALMNSRIIHEFDDGKFTTLEFYRKILGFFDIEPSDLPYHEFRRLWSLVNEPNKPLIALLREIREKRNPLMAIASNTQELHWEGVVRQHYHDVVSLFDTYILSYSVGFSKPDPRFYLEGAHRLGVELPNCVLIDDRPENGETFASMGGHVIEYHVGNHDAVERELRKLYRLENE